MSRPALLSLRLALLALLLPLLGGCLVSPLPDEDELRIELALPPSGVRSPEATFTPWDSQGLFHLEKFPKLVRVAVESQDYELRTGTWPGPSPKGTFRERASSNTTPAMA